ncbi:PilW family protein [Alishewanella sp. d11]|uniref:PilW family protein n=1 Tax=Alishewanella sp. d11 TaxID=3414030 RepID=UPI003BF90DF8
MAVSKGFSGFTLVELMVAMTLTVLLIGGVGSVYLTLKQTSTQVARLENAQEVLRSAHQVFYRSSLHASAITVSPSEVTFNQVANTLACDGSTPTVDFAERYYQQANNLVCQLTAANQQDITLMTYIAGISFSLTTDATIGATRLSVLLAPEGLPESFPILSINGQNLPGIQLEFALKTLIMNWAT